MTTETLHPDLNEYVDFSSEPNAFRVGATGGYEISLFDLLIVLAERKRFLLLVTAAFAILAIVISLLLPNRYTATVTLLTPQQNTSGRHGGADVGRRP
jgi:uncharacterized protein involved in exopolysaccharide biosynthesis